MKQKYAFKNVLFSLYNYIIAFLLSFIVRKCVIVFLGLEILGVDSVIIETISMLSLCELGIQTAIIHKLYRPVINCEFEKIQKIYSVYVKVYRYVGIVVLFLGIFFIPFLKVVVNSELSWKSVLTIYLLQLGSSVLNYFVACPRVLYLVHQKQYFCTKIDIIAKMFVFVIQLTVLVFIKNYYLYILCNYINIFMTNVIIGRHAKKDFLHNNIKYIASRTEILSVLSELKHVILGKISTFVYSSTDNLVISAFCGSIQVGFISNYKIITNALRSLVETMCISLNPIWGNYLNTGVCEEEVTSGVDIYNFFQFIISSMLLVPVLCCMEDFIKIWLGEEYVISTFIFYLIIADNYMNNMQQPCCTVMSSFGLFQEDKWISIIAAIVNIFFSILLVGKLGIVGVLLGTICAMSIYWFGRSLIYIKYICNEWKKELLIYWMKNINYALVFLLEEYIAKQLCRRIVISNEIVQLVSRGIVAEIVVCILLLGIFWNRKVFRNFWIKIVNPLIKKNKGEYV